MSYDNVLTAEDKKILAKAMRRVFDWREVPYYLFKKLLLAQFPDRRIAAVLRRIGRALYREILATFDIYNPAWISIKFAPSMPWISISASGLFIPRKRRTKYHIVIFPDIVIVATWKHTTIYSTAVWR